MTASSSSDQILLKPLNQNPRHGFEEEYESEQYLTELATNFIFYFDDKRHRTNANPVPEKEKLQDKDKFYQPIENWKIGKERVKTVAAALILCLHLGVDPPDVIKTQPCAILESWVDPLNFQDSKKAIEAIGKALQSRYEMLSSKTKYKQALDPCVEDLKRFCNTLRRAAKTERVLFHYNGHGVPKPTPSGEIWVFNRRYTQYIPVSLYDLQTWLGAPAIYVWDCNQAGNIVENFQKFTAKRLKDDREGRHDSAASSPTEAYKECFQLASCREDELLPMNEELPADLFTACLTSPIEISVKVYLMQSPLKDTKYAMLFQNHDNIRNPDGKNFTKLPDITIPGKSSDRRTPLGELNWIFTAITDTIAWTSLPRPLFNKLFRHDLIVAALFRNFLLAKRLMASYNCHPISDPPLPNSVIDHPMWDSWYLAIDQVLTKLIESMKNPTDPDSQQMLLNPKTKPNDVLNKYKSSIGSLSTMSLVNQTAGGNSQLIQNSNTNNNNNNNNNNNLSNLPANNTSYQQYSDFFVQNLTAFELWLKYGSNTRNPPEQLPIVLQVLLSQLHRNRALILLSKFLDLGPWAVYLSLSIGIFPYVLKLLQGPSNEMKPILVFIWARIMSIDHENTQEELIKEDGYMYFVRILCPEILQQQHYNGRNSSNGLVLNVPVSSASQRYQQASSGSAAQQQTFHISDEQKAMAAFILTSFARDFEVGQRCCFNADILPHLKNLIDVSDTPMLRQWCIILVGELYKRNPLYKIACLHNKLERQFDIFATLIKSLKDPVPEVRCSAIVSLSNFLSDEDETELIAKTHMNLTSQANTLQQQHLMIQNNPPQQQQNSNYHHRIQQHLHRIQIDLHLLQNFAIKEIKLQEVKIIVSALSLLNDGSPIVRKELIKFLSKVVNTYINFFIVIAFNELLEEILSLEVPGGVGGMRDEHKKNDLVGQNSIFNTIWKSVLILSDDPHPEIKYNAETVINYILLAMNENADLGSIVVEMEKYFIKRNEVGGRNINIFNTTSNINTNNQSSSDKNIIDEFSTAKNRNYQPKLIFGNGKDFNKDIGKNSNGSDNKDEDEPKTLTARFIKVLHGFARECYVERNNDKNDRPGTSNSMIASDTSANGGISRKLAKLSLLNVPYGVEHKPRTPRFEYHTPPASLYDIDIPIESTFIDYSKEYFQEPQMKKDEDDEPGSTVYQAREWRKYRNDNIIKKTQNKKELSLYGEWNAIYRTAYNKTHPKIFKFTQFEDYLVTADDRDNIRCYDWENDVILSTFCNENPFGTKITDMDFINEDDVPLLVTGSSDGIIKIFKNFHDVDNVEMVSSWRGLTDMLLTPRSTGLLTEWQQIRGTLLVTGDVKIIRVWDALTENVEVDIPAKTSSLVTSLTSDQLSGNIFVAGFSDGSLRCYDRRLNPRDSMIRLWRSGVGSKCGKSSWITNVHMQRGGYRELVSGNSNGVIELWDIRYQDPVLGFNEQMTDMNGNGGVIPTMSNSAGNSTTNFNTNITSNNVISKDSKSSMVTMQVHEHAPIIASGSRKIKIWTTSGDLIAQFKNIYRSSSHNNNTSTNLGDMVSSLTQASRTSPYLSSLTFHPHRMMIAANNSHDTSINIYKCEEKTLTNNDFY
ncbi:related to Target of rapamycin complex 1 subunit KOG1 [Saccharomycodes ludwigii]|uniref:Related to Target of rapamycin complex 1 subunit KOG1 n=1 Tax=Saccharomycodes ludwigii TaxID=36035 RepID=A0A376BA02_9ASCO|nr:related to Target of rapamycin complex 1 subunit KOG1 [Saccharomycodes ludwigii]